MGFSYLIETYFPAAKGLVSIVVVGCIVIGMMAKDRSDKKKAGAKLS